jgi:hypothetical protein
MKERQPMSIYRRIYTEHFGPIPKGYHIHHKDGNHSNNDPLNLVAIAAKEHYDIHFSQGDYGACWAMYRTGHMTLTSEERSALVSKQQKMLLESNKHPFQDQKIVKRTGRFIWIKYLKEHTIFNQDLFKEYKTPRGFLKEHTTY